MYKNIIKRFDNINPDSGPGRDCHKLDESNVPFVCEKASQILGPLLPSLQAPST